MKRHHLTERAHLEALFVAHVLIDESLVDAVEESRLSPAANELLDMIAEWPWAMRSSFAMTAAGAEDEFVTRLAMRVQSLTLADLTTFARSTVVQLCNRLPEISARRKSAA